MTLSFKELTPPKAASFITILDESDINHRFSSKSKILMRDLSFAPEWARIDAEDYTESPFVKQSFFLKDKTVHPFVYSETPFQDNFKTIDIIITDKTVVEYLIHYCHLWIMGGEILKPALSFDDVLWQEDATPMVRKSLDKDFQKYPQIAQSKDSFDVTMICVFRQSLIEITFNVKTDGGVTISNRTILIEDLPVNNLP